MTLRNGVFAEETGIYFPPWKFRVHLASLTVQGSGETGAGAGRKVQTATVTQVLDAWLETKI